MIDQEMVERKIELIREDLEKLREVQDKTFDELAHDYWKWNGVQHILQKIIGRGIDINQHLIAELADTQTKAPRDYEETFTELAELKILPWKFAEKIAASGGFRNRLVHEYNHLDEEVVYNSVGEAIAQYARYCNYILKFLEKSTTL